MVRVGLVPSPSAPELGVGPRGPRRNQLQRLLTRATAGGEPPHASNSGAVNAARYRAPSYPSRSIDSPKVAKRIGGCPFSPAPQGRQRPLSYNVAAHAIESKANASRRGVSLTREGLPARPAHVDNPANCNVSAQPDHGVELCQKESAHEDILNDKAGRYVRRLVGEGTVSDKQEWKLVQELDAVDHLLGEDRSRRIEKEKRQKNASAVEVQRQQERHRRDQHHEEMRQWKQEFETDAQKYKNEEEQKKQCRMDAHRRHNEAVENQRDDLRRRRQEQNDEDERLANELKMQAAAALQQEKQQDDRRKLQQKNAALKIADDAKEAAVKRSEKKHEEALLDVEMCRQQKEMLDKQERDRNQYYEGLRSKQAAKQAAYEAGAGNDIARQLKADDERAQREQSVRAQKERQATEEKEQRLQNMRDSGIAAVATQLEHQQKERDRLKDEEKKFGERFRIEAENAKADDRNKETRRRSAEQENQEYLRFQMNQRKGAPGKFGHDRMNDVERSMNRDRLDRVEGPEGIQMLIENKQLEYRIAGGAQEAT